MWLPEGTTVAMLQDRFASAMTLDEFIERAEAKQLSKEDRYREMRRWYARDHGRTALEEIAQLLERTAVL